MRVLDFYENHGKALPHYVAELDSRGYDYGVDYLPHDAKVRELSTGRTRVETLRSLGRNPGLVPDHKLADGINAARITLNDCWFNELKCRDGIETLHQYRRAFDDKTRAFSNVPKHDFSCHGADSFRYLSMAWREMVEPQKREEPQLFIPIQEMTIGDWISAENIGERRGGRA